MKMLLIFCMLLMVPLVSQAGPDPGSGYDTPYFIILLICDTNQCAVEAKWEVALSHVPIVTYMKSKQVKTEAFKMLPAVYRLEDPGRRSPLKI